MVVQECSSVNHKAQPNASIAVIAVWLTPLSYTQTFLVHQRKLNACTKA